MANGKKSFLLYTDVFFTVEKLSDENAGMLFKTILAYVNDKNPVVKDPLIEIAFEPIKQSLKRDLRKYEEIREKRREAGKASADKRQQVLTSVEHDEQVLTSATVNDNVIVNDNDIVNVNKEGKKIKKYNNIPPSFEEIELRYKERGLKNFVLATFFAHYETNGWMVGKNKMKNWDAALTYWENNNKPNNNANNRGNNTRSIKRINDHWN